MALTNTTVEFSEEKHGSLMDTIRENSHDLGRGIEGDGQSPLALVKSDEAEAEAESSKVSVYDYAVAASFNEVSMPGEIARLNHNQIRTQEINGEYSNSQGGGRITLINGIQYDAHGNPVDEEKDEGVEAFRDAAERADDERRDDLKQSSLDRMEWSGDQNEILTFAGQTGKAIDWYNAARTVRKNLGKLAEENHWSKEEETEQDKVLAQYMEALKKDDKDAQQKAWEKMKPELQANVNESLKNSADIGIVEDYGQSSTTKFRNSDSKNSSMYSANAIETNLQLAPIFTEAAAEENIIEKPEIKIEQKPMQMAQVTKPQNIASSF